MASLVASMYATLDLTDNLTPGLKKAHGALDALGSALKVVGAGAFLGKIVHEAMQAEESIVDLKNAFKGYADSFAPATAAAGRWGTVTRKSGDYVDSWEKSLKAANATMDKFHAQEAAGIPLTKAQTAAYQKADAAQQQYGGALAGATTTQKVWITGQAGINKGLAFTYEESVKLAGALQKVTRFSDETIQRAEGMLATFHNLGRKVFPEATELALDMATKFKTDVQSATIQLGKALQDPIQGVTALRRVGIQLSDAQEKQIRQFMKLGQIEKAQGIILAEVRSQVGGLAREMGQTLGGQIDILGNRFGDFLQTMGETLMPTLRGLVGIFGGVLDALEPLAPVLALTAVAMGALALASSPIVAALMPILVPIALITGAVALLKSAWENDFLGIRSAVTEAYNTIKPELDKLGAAFGNVLAILNSGQAPGEVGPERFEPTPGKLGGGAGTAKAKKSDFGERLAKAIDQAWPQVEIALAALGVKLGPAITKLWDTVKPAIEAGATQIIGLIGPLVNQHIVAPFLAELVKLDPATMFAKLIAYFIPGGGFGGIFKDLGTQIDIVGAVTTAVTTAITWLEGAGKTLWDGTFGMLVKSAANLMGGIGAALTGSVKQGLIGILKAIGPIASIVGVGGVAIAIEQGIKSLEGKAGGGDVVGGRSIIVGEKGPELYTPGRSGSITPNNRLGGGGPTIINLNAYGVNDSAALVRKVNNDLRRRNRRPI